MTEYLNTREALIKQYAAYGEDSSGLVYDPLSRGGWDKGYRAGLECAFGIVARALSDTYGSLEARVAEREETYVCPYCHAEVNEETDEDWCCEANHDDAGEKLEESS